MFVIGVTEEGWPNARRANDAVPSGHHRRAVTQRAPRKAKDLNRIWREPARTEVDPIDRASVSRPGIVEVAPPSARELRRRLTGAIETESSQLRDYAKRFAEVFNFLRIEFQLATLLSMI
jgi:hypothetical protein